MQSKLLTFFMLKEAELDEETADAEFRINLLANNPNLYKEVFGFEEVGEDGFEVIQPETEEELQTMLTDMKRHLG